MKTRKSKRKHNKSSSCSSMPNHNTCDNLVDRISSLPDSILGNVLSYLPTKNAVATTILSKRWKSVWINVHNLDFYIKDLDEWSDDDEDYYMSFVEFVNRVLLLNGGGLLNKFRLSWEPDCIPDFVSSQVNSWVSIAITRNVNELFLYFNSVFAPPPDLYEMPTSVFIYDSLQCLELEGSIRVTTAVVVSLPRLESLKLDKIYYGSRRTFQRLLSGCPKLKILHVVLINQLDDDDYVEKDGEEEDEDVVTYTISLPYLRHLHLNGISIPWIFTSDDILELEAPSLEYLKLKGCIPKVFVQGSLSSLVEVDLGIELYKEGLGEDLCNSLAKSVHSFDCVKALTLSPDVFWALSKATIPLFTKFTRLTTLKAGFGCCCFTSFHDILQCSDSLQDLKIHKDAYKKHSHNHSNWTAPLEVSKCLSSSLKKVSLEGYTGSNNDLEIIGYLLKRGSVLQVMKVSFNRFGKMKGREIDLVKEICRFPRKSPACTIEFIE